MPFKPFTAAHSSVKKGSKHADPVTPVKAIKKAVNATRVPKPDGQGPAGANGYFDKPETGKPGC